MGDVLDQTGDLTVSAWFYCTSFANQYQGIVIKGVSFRNYSLAINAGGLADYMWAEGICSVTGPQLSISLTTSTWYHVVGVRNVGGQGGVIYINGIRRYGDSGASKSANAEVLGIGIGGGGFWPFTGLIEDVRIWNRALLPSEVLQLYMEPYAIFIPPGPRLLRQFIVTGNPRLGTMNAMGF